MPRVPFPNLVGPSNTPSSVIADGEDTINLFPEKIDALGAKPPFPYFLQPTPGFSSFGTLATTPIQTGGLFQINNRCWTFTGGVQPTLYELASDGTSTTLSVGLNANGDPVTWAANGVNGDQVLLTTGQCAYCLTISTGAVAKVIDWVSHFARQCGFLDGYFLAIDPVNSELQVSALSDGTSWPALGVTQRSAGADTWQAMIVSHKLIWLLGSLTSEVWYDAGLDPDQPFAPDPSGFLQWGIVAPFSLIEMDNAPIWLARRSDGAAVLVRANGYDIQRISTHGFEYQIQRYSRLDDAYAWTYQQDGHTFYVLTFPTANVTWVYDAATQLFHKRAEWNAPSRQYDAYRANSHCYAFGQHLVGDSQSGTIFTMDPTVATGMDGNGIRRLRRTPHIAGLGNRLFVPRLELNLDVGDGLTDGQGDDPQIMLRCSKDGGRTYGTEIWASAGAIGNYSARTFWNRLGVGRDWVFEVTLSDPVVGASRWVQAWIDVEQGVS